MKPTQTRTGGQVVCDVMLEEGVDAIFGMPGGASLPFYDALYHYPQIRHCRLLRISVKPFLLLKE